MTIQNDVSADDWGFDFEAAHKKINQTPLEMVREFAMCMDHPLRQKWLSKSTEAVKLEHMRWELIAEEFWEASDESEAKQHPEAMLKEMADIIYVVFGYCATYGWDLDEAVRRVHASNMSKMGPDRSPIKREDGKVLKGLNYKKPDLSDLVGVK